MMVVVNVSAWRKVVEGTVSGIANESLQRRAWFGIGPEVSSPGEMINQLFDDAAIEDFLVRKDTGLDDRQIKAGWRLVQLMDELSKKLPQYPKFIDPTQLIDDPRWKEIREAASEFSALLSK